VLTRFCYGVFYLTILKENDYRLFHLEQIDP
jgi:hypothetical protein